MIRFESRYAAGLRSLKEALCRARFELALSQWLGADPFRALYLGSEEEVALSDRINEQVPGSRALFHLVLLEESVRPAELEPSLSAAVLADLVGLGLLVEEDGRLRTDFYRIIPFEGCCYVAHPLLHRCDAWGRPAKRAPTVYLGSDSAELCRAARAFGLPDRGGRALDLCTGSGFVGIWLASASGCEVLATEVDPEAVETARANVEMNGMSRQVEIVEGDLYLPASGRSFSRILANPPFIPCPIGQEYARWGGGGELGLDLIERIVAGARPHLLPDGTLHLVARVFGGPLEPRICGLLDRELGARSIDAENHLLLSERRPLDREALEAFASASLRSGAPIADHELGAATAAFQAHYTSLGLSHEYWAVLSVRGGAPGYRWDRLYDWIHPGLMVRLRRDLRWSDPEDGILRLVFEDSTELTGVPSRDAEFLRMLDGIRTLSVVAGLLEITPAQSADLARLYLRAGAVEIVEAPSRRPSSQ